MPAGLYSGDLIHRVEIHANTPATDDYGHEVASWASVGRRWARIKPLSAEERIRANQYGGSVTHEVTMRHTSLARPERRIVYGTRTFEIVSVINTNEDNIETVCICREDLRGDA